MELGGAPDDQGPHNFIYYCTDLGATGKANGDIVATLGYTSPDSISFTNSRYFVNGKYPKVLHQFDRNREMQRQLSTKYL
jgi:hypothetical protein